MNEKLTEEVLMNSIKDLFSDTFNLIEKYKAPGGKNPEFSYWEKFSADANKIAQKYGTLGHRFLVMAMDIVEQYVVEGNTVYDKLKESA